MTSGEYFVGTICAFILGMALGIRLVNSWWREKWLLASPLPTSDTGEAAPTEIGAQGDD